jgi:hypothetical protein
MEIGQALAFFDSCRFWSVTTGAASCAFDAPKPKSRAEVPFWRPFVRTAVRRKHGESLDAMIVRCAALAAERKASGWLNPVPGAGLRCGERELPAGARGLRPDRQAGQLSPTQNCNPVLQNGAPRYKRTGSERQRCQRLRRGTPTAIEDGMTSNSEYTAETVARIGKESQRDAAALPGAGNVLASGRACRPSEPPAAILSRYSHDTRGLAHALANAEAEVHLRCLALEVAVRQGYASDADALAAAERFLAGR